MTTLWSLEPIGAGNATGNFVIARLPCHVGRGKENDLVIANLGLSRAHAALMNDITGQLRLIDKNSTNGTFVNRQRVEGYCLLKENDTVYFAGAGFRLRSQTVDPRNTLPFDEMLTTLMPGDTAPGYDFPDNEAEFDELIAGEGLSVAAQPIVDAHDRRIAGYELLGRCLHPQLPRSPIDLFTLAQSLGREAELSRAFRDFGIARVAPRLGNSLLFINAHPKEMFDEAFFASLEHWRKKFEGLGIVVEIHESAVTHIEQLRKFAARLAQLGIRFAYDDFGAGQARLLELADVPAHFVKFDISLIQGLHTATERKRQIIRDLVKIVLSTGSVPLAEGVEEEEEAQICVALGFTLIQGFLTGKPIPADAF